MSIETPRNVRLPSRGRVFNYEYEDEQMSDDMQLRVLYSFRNSEVPRVPAEVAGIQNIALERMAVDVSGMPLFRKEEIEEWANNVWNGTPAHDEENWLLLQRAQNGEARSFFLVDSYIPAPILQKERERWHIVETISKVTGSSLAVVAALVLGRNALERLDTPRAGDEEVDKSKRSFLSQAGAAGGWALLASATGAHGVRALAAESERNTIEHSATWKNMDDVGLARAIEGLSEFPIRFEAQGIEAAVRLLGGSNLERRFKSSLLENKLYHIAQIARSRGAGEIVAIVDPSRAEVSYEMENPSFETVEERHAVDTANLNASFHVLEERGIDTALIRRSAEILPEVTWNSTTSRWEVTMHASPVT